jgi:hypothetical protein
MADTWGRVLKQQIGPLLLEGTKICPQEMGMRVLRDEGGHDMLPEKISSPNNSQGVPAPCLAIIDLEGFHGSLGCVITRL